MSDVKARLQIAIGLLGAEKLKLLQKATAANAKEAQKLAAQYGKLAGAESRLQGVQRSMSRAHDIERRQAQAQFNYMQKQRAAEEKGRARAAAQQHRLINETARRDRALAHGQLRNAMVAQNVRRMREMNDAREARFNDKHGPGARAARGVRGFMGGLFDFGAKASIIGFGIAGAFRTIGAAASAAITPIMDFQSAMTQVRIKGGKAFTPEVMRDLSEQAKQMGRTTMFAPTEAAAAQIDLAASGMGGAAIKANLGTVLKFAQASDMSTAESSGFLLNVARQFGLNTDDGSALLRVGNAVKNAADMSTISERDIQHTFRYAGALSSQAGVTPEMLAAMTAVAGNFGVKASQAGTGVRNMIASIVKPKGGKLTQSMLGELGLDAKQVGAIGTQENGVPKLLQLLGKRMSDKKWDKATRLKFLYSMFGQYGATAAGALIDAAMTPAKDGINNTIQAAEQEIRNSMGALDAAADLKAKTIEGRMKTVKARLETLGVTAGEAMLPHIEKALDKVIVKLGEFEKFAASPEGQAAFASMGTAFDLMAKSLAAMGPGLEMMMKVVNAYTAFVDKDALKVGEQKGSLLKLGPDAPTDRPLSAEEIANFKRDPDAQNAIWRKEKEQKTRTDKGLTPDKSAPPSVFDLENAWNPNQSNITNEAIRRVAHKSAIEISIKTDPGTKASVTSIKGGAATVTTNQSFAP